MYGFYFALVVVCLPFYQRCEINEKTTKIHNQIHIHNARRFSFIICSVYRLNMLNSKRNGLTGVAVDCFSSLFSQIFSNFFFSEIYARVLCMYVVSQTQRMESFDDHLANLDLMQFSATVFMTIFGFSCSVFSV